MLAVLDAWLSGIYRKQFVKQKQSLEQDRRTRFSVFIYALLVCPVLWHRLLFCKCLWEKRVSILAGKNLPADLHFQTVVMGFQNLGAIVWVYQKLHSYWLLLKVEARTPFKKKIQGILLKCCFRIDNVHTWESGDLASWYIFLAK